MLRGIFKFILSFFFAAIFVISVGQTEALSNTHSHSIVRHDVNIGCADNAVAPLNSIKDIQTFLNCNGFSPGPIDITKIAANKEDTVNLKMPCNIILF